MWWLLDVDGPVPVGNIIYVVGVIGLGAWAIVESYSSASDERIIDEAQEETADVEESDKTVVGPRQQPTEKEGFF